MWTNASVRLKWKGPLNSFEIEMISGDKESDRIGFFCQSNQELNYKSKTLQPNNNKLGQFTVNLMENKYLG